MLNIFSFQSKVDDNYVNVNNIKYTIKLKYISVICHSRDLHLGKFVPEFLSLAKGRRPRAVLKTEGTVFPKTD